jgi:hypothetical protein
VRQDRVVWNATRERRGKGVNVIESLAGEAPFVEQILVDIRNGANRDPAALVIVTLTRG